MQLRKLVSAIMAFVVVGSATAESFTYSDFADTSGLNLVGDAVVASDRLQLTAPLDYQVGGVWYASQVDISTTFEATFAFRITDLGGSIGFAADGLALVLQNHTSTALGGSGAGLGYGHNEIDDAGIPNSLAIEIDTWSNEWLSEPTEPHVSIQTRGLLENDPDHGFSLGSAVGLPDVQDGTAHVARVAYEGGMMSVYIDELQSPLLEVPVDLASILDLTDGQRAWIGLTSGTGTAWQRHEILSWSFVPEPTSVAGLMLGVAVLASRRSRPSIPGRCQCGYDLRGNVSGVCTECGTRVVSTLGRSAKS